MKLKNQKVNFLCLGTSVVGNMLIGKGLLRAGRRYNNIEYMDKKI